MGIVSGIPACKSLNIKRADLIRRAICRFRPSSRRAVRPVMWRLLWTFGLFSVSDGLPTIVEAPVGKIMGSERTSRDGREYLAYTKIPYAKPPVGQLRLAAPEPIDKWEGILNATALSPQCSTPVQLPLAEASEDCLYLNIFRPKIDKMRLPVLFYVHGGAFLIGYSYSGVTQAPEYIMDEDVLLVSVDYRLAALGFMSMNTTEFPGNYGLKDQAMALKWVKENIEAFGGDPNSITVFGESAGGASSHYLLLSPLTKDMVSRSVSISGLINTSWGLKKVETNMACSRRIADAVGCKQSRPSAVLECLRAIKDPNVFNRAFADISKDGMLENPIVPVIEPEGPGAFASTDLRETASTKPMITSFAAGEYTIVEMMFRSYMKGSSGNPIMFAEKFLEEFYGNDEGNLTEAVKRLKDHYMNKNHTKPERIFRDGSMAVQDLSFVYPAMAFAESYKGLKWLYRMEHRAEYTFFDMLSKQKNKVPGHGDELLSLFNLRKYLPRAKAQQNPEDLRVSKELIKYVVNFAYFDNPTPEGSGLPVWKPYKGNEILRIKTGQSEMGDSAFIDKQKRILHLWNELLGTTKWI